MMNMLQLHHSSGNLHWWCERSELHKFGPLNLNMFQKMKIIQLIRALSSHLKRETPVWARLSLFNPDTVLKVLLHNVYFNTLHNLLQTLTYSTTYNKQHSGTQYGIIMTYWWGMWGQSILWLQQNTKVHFLFFFSS